MKAAVSSALYCQEAGYLQEAIMPTRRASADDGFGHRHPD
jgi:hypothetical protein